MKSFGPWELILILLVVLVIFGGAKLPQIGKGLGDAIKEFRKASKGEDEKPGAKDATVKAADSAVKPETKS